MYICNPTPAELYLYRMLHNVTNVSHRKVGADVVVAAVTAAASFGGAVFLEGFIAIVVSPRIVMFCNSSNTLANLTVAYMTFPRVEYLDLKISGLVVAALAIMFPIVKDIVVGFLTYAGLADIFILVTLVPFAPIGASVTLSSVSFFALVETCSDPIVGIVAMMPVFDFGSVVSVLFAFVVFVIRRDLRSPPLFIILIASFVYILICSILNDVTYCVKHIAFSESSRRSHVGNYKFWTLNLEPKITINKKLEKMN
uniref:Uncharacterized protein n=1 Tax=Glossina austeni TaxID=7395 RepID=A0A1A9VGX5_GLOAU